MKTHYDVLNLEKDCTAKEIKDSFIKLSKEYHPDKNKSSDAHKRFVEVNEAYSVLGKPNTRYSYDASLERQQPRMHCNTGCNTKTPYEHYVEMYARHQNRNQHVRNGYFTKSKLSALLVCCFLMALGSGIQLIAMTKRRDKRSQEIATILKQNRDRYNRIGMRQVIKEMEEAAAKRKFQGVKREE